MLFWTLIKVCIAVNVLWRMHNRGWKCFWNDEYECFIKERNWYNSRVGDTFISLRLSSCYNHNADLLQQYDPRLSLREARHCTSFHQDCYYKCEYESEVLPSSTQLTSTQTLKIPLVSNILSSANTLLEPLENLQLSIYLHQIKQSSSLTY